LAPLHHRYGHALLEHAIATSGALGGGGGGAGGKEAPMPSRNGGASTVASARAQEGETKKTQAAAAAVASSSSAKTHDPRFTFGGDAEESDDDDDEQNNAADAGADEEDDLGDAFAVLELARVRYERLVEQNATLDTLDGEHWSTLIVKGQLAEVLNDLADVGLESENFQQASSDYRLALELLQPLLQPHSRRLADANLRLGLALEFHPEAAMQASAETYVTAALTTLKRRLEALAQRKEVLQRQRDGGQAGQADVVEPAAEVRAEKVAEESAARLREEGILSSAPSSNGKGKHVDNDSKLLEKDDVAAMDWQAVEKELRDMQEMVRELELKLEEYANAPPGAAMAAVDDSALRGGSGSGSSAGGSILQSAETKAALKKAIDEALLGSSTNSITSSSNGNGISTTFGASRSNDPNVQINDLSAMVKKKKRTQPATEQATGSHSKKTRVEDDS
jgi:HAT1-interacting factor 1